jgi:hypothetical protein
MMSTDQEHPVESLYPQRIVLQAEAEKAVAVSKTTVFETERKPVSGHIVTHEGVSQKLSQKECLKSVPRRRVLRQWVISGSGSFSCSHGLSRAGGQVFVQPVEGAQIE